MTWSRMPDDFCTETVAKSSGYCIDRTMQYCSHEYPTAYLPRAAIVKFYETISDCTNGVPEDYSVFYETDSCLKQGFKGGSIMYSMYGSSIIKTTWATPDCSGNAKNSTLVYEQGLSSFTCDNKVRLVYHKWEHYEDPHQYKPSSGGSGYPTESFKMQPSWAPSPKQYAGG